MGVTGAPLGWPRMKYQTQTGSSGNLKLSRLVFTLTLAAAATSCASRASDDAIDGSASDDEAELYYRSRQCRDGIDNDQDGRIDYPADKGCSSRNDNSEGSDNNTPPPPDAPLPP